MQSYESIDNLSLIRNGLLHVQFEINSSTPSMFRAARESHSILYRSMIEALKGSANLAITGKSSKTRKHQYSFGNEPFKEIQKTAVPGCKKAWRFSQPIVCDPQPEIDYTWRNQELRRENYLKPFYDALAMIQSECFMSQYVMSTKVTVTDDEMERLEWLHEDIRNEYEHFVPKGYSAPIDSLVDLTILSLRLSREVLFDSKNTFPSDKSISTLIDATIETLRNTQFN